MVSYKDLLYFMVLREIKVLYKQTILGFSWAIIRPLFSMIIFSIIFGNLAEISSDGIPYPLFSYSALVPWIYFSSSLIKSTNSLIGNTNIFTKVYFPRIIMPLAPIISNLLDFFISLSIIFILMIYYGLLPSVNILWLPLLIFLMIINAAGVGIWLSALAIQYRDIRHATLFLVQLLMYAAPVVWPISMLSDKYGPNILIWYGLYPMAGVIEGFRSAIIGSNSIPWSLIIMGFISSFVILFSGIIYFQIKERIFADIA